MTDERQTTTAATSPTDGDSSSTDDASTATAVAEAPAETAASDDTAAESSAAETPQAETAQAETAQAESTEPAPQAAAESEPETLTEAEPAPEIVTEAPQAAAEAEPAAAAEPKAEAASSESEATAAGEAEAETVVAAAADSAETPTEAKAEEPAAASEAPAEAQASATTEASEATAATAAEPSAASDEVPKTETAEAKASETKAEASGVKDGEKDGEAAKAEKKAEKAEKAEKEEPAELDDPELLALREAKESGSLVTGRVIGWNRGGFHVVIGEITAFCPSSEMELGRPRSPNTYLDRDLEFKVVKFQRRGRRVVLSRSETLKAHRDEVLAGLKPGQVAKGVVSSLPDFGAFVDLGGVEGLVHVSEISRSRVKNPKEVLKLGQEVEVKVLKIEDGGERISLSMKELEPDPWKGVADKFPRGSEFTGKILRAADFGLFVELEPDVEGLIHVSQLEPGQDMKDEALQPGQEVKGWIREVDSKRHRISLSLREVPDDDPWKTATERFPEGEMTEGTVESIAPFGVFINLAPGLTGLLPNSQTGLPRGTSPARVYSPGQKVGVQVLTIDTRRKRISLGKEGSRVEATKADLQEYRKQVRQEEKQAPGAMAAAFAKLRGDDDDES